MQTSSRNLVLALFFECIGCAGAVSDPADKGDAGRINTQTDPDNCGRLKNVCIARGDGACREGYCRCHSNSDCHWPAECHEGICQESDAKGDKCWGDKDCAGNQYCIGGHCSPRACLTEICDGYDNDCDGQTDEAEDTDKPCYTGPPGTLGIGACHAGKHVCFLGSYTECQGEWVPHAEVGRFACDKEDSDCDGCVDGTGGATAGCTPVPLPIIDIFVMIDYSGSMQGYIDAGKAVFHSLSKFSGNDRFRFGLFTMTDESAPGYLKVLQPMTDFETFRVALDAITGEGSGIEPTYDAVYRVANGDFDAEIGFRSGSLPVYIVFGDEEAQTVLVPPTTEVTACKAVDDRGVLLSLITLPTVYTDWDMCAAKFSFPLSTNPADMMKSLDSVLSLPCFDNP